MTDTPNEPTDSTTPITEQEIEDETTFEQHFDMVNIIASEEADPGIKLVDEIVLSTFRLLRRLYPHYFTVESLQRGLALMSAQDEQATVEFRRHAEGFGMNFDLPGDEQVGGLATKD
jgi:hypothetical protein